MNILIWILIFILILLIISECINRFADNKLYYPKIKFLDFDDEIKNYKIKKIGIIRSFISLKIPFSNVIRHTDLILETKKGLFAILQTYDDEHKYDYLIEVIKVDNLNFEYKNYFYTTTQLEPITTKWKLGEVYKLVVEDIKLPYHILRHNCHHWCDNVINIVKDKDIKAMNKFKIKHFEWYTSSFAPLIYMFVGVTDLIIPTIKRKIYNNEQK